MDSESNDAHEAVHLRVDLFFVFLHSLSYLLLFILVNSSGWELANQTWYDGSFPGSLSLIDQNKLPEPGAQISTIWCCALFAEDRVSGRAVGWKW